MTAEGGGIDFLVKALATWRVANILISERGPFDVFTKVRAAFGVKHDIDGEPISWPDNSVFSCLWCMSVWVGIAFSVLPLKMAKPFAFSTVAIIVKEWIDGKS